MLSPEEKMFQQAMGGPIESPLFIVTPRGRKWANSSEARSDTLSRNIINTLETFGPISVFELEAEFGNTVEPGQLERSVSGLLRNNFIKRRF